MTPFAASVAREITAALVPVETVSIIDHEHLATTTRTLLHNALFYVVPTTAIDSARANAQERAEALAATIGDVGIVPNGVSLAVDRARRDAVEAFHELIDAVADAEPTRAARYLGIG